MEFKLVTYGSWLQITPFWDPLTKELQFFHRSQEIIEKEYFRRGELITIKQRGGMKSTTECLYTVVYDEQEKPVSIISYRALLFRVCDQLQAAGHTFTLERRGRPLLKPEIAPWVCQGLRPKQVEFVCKMLAAAGTHAIGGFAGGCMGEGATGIGKTWVIASLVRAYYRQARKILIITDSQSVVRSLFHELSTEIFKGSEIRVGITQGPNVLIQPVTISTVKMLHLHEPDDVDVMIYDEVHGAAAAEASEMIMAYGNAVKFGLSGTITGRSDGKEKFLESLIGPIVAEITDQEAEELGWVSPQHTYLLSVPQGPNCIGKPEHWQEKHGIWYNSYRNGLIKDICELAPKDEQLLVFVRTTEHLEELINNWLPPGFTVLHGEISAKERKRIERDFVDGKILRLIGTDCIKQGINTKNLFVMINANWTTSRTGVMQRRGRNRRMAEGKNFGVLVDFADEWQTLRYKEELRQKLEMPAIAGFPVLEEVNDAPDTLKNRALKRASHYRKAGDQIFKIDSPSEIQFNQ